MTENEVVWCCPCCCDDDDDVRSDECTQGRRQPRHYVAHGTQCDGLGVHQHESEPMSSASQRQDPHCGHAERAGGAAPALQATGVERASSHTLRYGSELSGFQDSGCKLTEFVVSVEKISQDLLSASYKSWNGGA